MPRCLDIYGCTVNEFQPSHLTLTHPDPSLFVKSQWSKIREPYYVIYRLVIALTFIGWVVADYVTETNEFYEGDPSLWFIFATNWVFTFLTVTTIIEAICAPVYLWKSREDKSMPVYLSIQWFFFTVSCNTCIVITVCYWVFLISMDHAGFLVTPMSKAKHTVVTVYVILNLFIVATPIRFLHVLYVLCLELIYVVFNALYFLDNGQGPDGKPYSYTILKWAKEPFEATAFSFVVFLASAFSQIFLCLLCTSRQWIANGYEHRFSQEESETMAILDEQETDYNTVQTEMKDMSK